MIQRAGGEGGFDFREFVVEQARERRPVHDWYRTVSQGGLTSVVGLIIRQVVDCMTENRGGRGAGSDQYVIWQLGYPKRPKTALFDRSRR